MHHPTDRITHTTACGTPVVCLLLICLFCLLFCLHLYKVLLLSFVSGFFVCLFDLLFCYCVWLLLFSFLGVLGVLFRVLGVLGGVSFCC